MEFWDQSGCKIKRTVGLIDTVRRKFRWIVFRNVGSHGYRICSNTKIIELRKKMDSFVWFPSGLWKQEGGQRPRVFKSLRRDLGHQIWVYNVKRLDYKPRSAYWLHLCSKLVECGIPVCPIALAALGFYNFFRLITDGDDAITEQPAPSPQ